MSKFWSTLWLKLKPALGLVIWVVLVLWLLWVLPETSDFSNRQAWWWHIK